VIALTFVACAALVDGDDLRRCADDPAEEQSPLEEQ
jgi:hypothetical protein